MHKMLRKIAKKMSKKKRLENSQHLHKPLKEFKMEKRQKLMVRRLRLMRETTKKRKPSWPNSSRRKTSIWCQKIPMFPRSIS